MKRLSLVSAAGSASARVVLGGTSGSDDSIGFSSFWGPIFSRGGLVGIEVDLTIGGGNWDQSTAVPC